MRLLNVNTDNSRMGNKFNKLLEKMFNFVKATTNVVIENTVFIIIKYSNIPFDTNICKRIYDRVIEEETNKD